MKVSIIGLGWLGAPLAHSLVAQGHQVSGTTRSVNKMHELRSFRIDSHVLEQGRTPSEESLFDTDVCVLNIPPFPGQAEWFKTWPWKKQTHLIFLSSTSIYGEIPGLVSELTPVAPETDNARELELDEHWVQKNFSSWTILRLSGLLGHDRHPGKFLSGRKGLKGKEHPVNLIHQKDALGFIEKVMEKKITQEIFNVSSDERRSRKEYYQGFAKSKGLELPIFDESDESTGKIILNEKMKKHYQLRVPLMP